MDYLLSGLQVKLDTDMHLITAYLNNSREASI